MPPFLFACLRALPIRRVSPHSLGGTGQFFQKFGAFIGIHDHAFFGRHAA